MLTHFIIGLINLSVRLYIVLYVYIVHNLPSVINEFITAVAHLDRRQLLHVHAYM